MLIFFVLIGFNVNFVSLRVGGKVLLMVLYVIFVIYCVMGKNYDVVVFVVGYCSLSLGVILIVIVNM